MRHYCINNSLVSCSYLSHIGAVVSNASALSVPKCLDTSAPVPICLMDSSALVPKCLGSEVSVHRSPGLPVPSVERDWLMHDHCHYCLFQCVLIGIVAYVVAAVVLNNADDTRHGQRGQTQTPLIRLGSHSSPLPSSPSLIDCMVGRSRSCA